jgi:hypothetical protein
MKIYKPTWVIIRKEHEDYFGYKVGDRVLSLPTKIEELVAAGVLKIDESQAEKPRKK